MILFENYFGHLLQGKVFSQLCTFISKSVPPSYMKMTLDTDHKGKNPQLCSFMSLQVDPITVVCQVSRHPLGASNSVYRECRKRGAMQQNC